MASAREEFGPPKTQTSNFEQRMRDLQQTRLAEIKQLGQSLQDAGVKHDGAAQAQQSGLKNTTAGNDARKDLGVAQGERPALSPDDRNRQIGSQAKQQGETLKKANATGGQSVTAAKQFAPPSQPKATSPPVPSRSR